jgi:hypothetical protein
MTGTQSPAGRLLAVSVLLAVSTADKGRVEMEALCSLSVSAHITHVCASMHCHTLCSLRLLRSAWRYRSALRPHIGSLRSAQHLHRRLPDA